MTIDEEAALLYAGIELLANPIMKLDELSFAELVQEIERTEVALVRRERCSLTFSPCNKSIQEFKQLIQGKAIEVSEDGERGIHVKGSVNDIHYLAMKDDEYFGPLARLSKHKHTRRTT